MKKPAKFKSIFHFDRLFTKLKIINVNGAGSLRLSRNYRTTDYAPGIVILAGIIKIRYKKIYILYIYYIYIYYILCIYNDLEPQGLACNFSAKC